MAVPIESTMANSFRVGVERDAAHSKNFALQLASAKETEADIRQAVEREWTTLNISHRNLAVLPPSIGDMPCVRRLLLNNNCILMPPTEIVRLLQLEELILDHNKLTVLPSGLGQLVNLRYLSLSHNCLGYLPPEIGDLRQLTELWLTGCELVFLPSEIGLLCSLQKMGVRDNMLSSLPSELCQCLRLTWLSLAGNKLQDLPAHFERLESLIYLDLNENEVLDIPRSLAGMRNMSTLLLRKNSIRSLPDDILVGFSGLTKLDLRDNEITVRPKHWKGLDFILLGTSDNDFSDDDIPDGRMTPLDDARERYHREGGETTSSEEDDVEGLLPSSSEHIPLKV